MSLQRYRVLKSMSVSAQQLANTRPDGSGGARHIDNMGGDGNNPETESTAFVQPDSGAAKVNLRSITVDRSGPDNTEAQPGDTVWLPPNEGTRLVAIGFVEAA